MDVPSVCTKNSRTVAPDTARATPAAAQASSVVQLL
jgi:hypothetical protein